ncbi:MAG TPA: nitrate reductase cytochrome c-type subunit [Anaeromyxobacteraceae bacterium]|nr:nitrate reductase cytochrome c-type subunit [Anaeromyxobacteraceae bacterium]
MRSRYLFGSLLLAACAAGQKPVAQAPVPAQAHASTLGIPDRQMGLSKASVFDVPEQKPFVFPKDTPGGNDKLPRAFPGAPPAIPHDVLRYLPITASRNRCADCHNVGKTEGEFDPTPIPTSHHIDWRNAPGVVKKEVAGTRWVCTSCHVPQAGQTPPVGNSF